MKTALNLISIAILGAIGVGSYLGTQGGPGTLDGAGAASPDAADSGVYAPDPAPVVDTIPDDPLADDGAQASGAAQGDSAILHSVTGTMSGYFIANEPIRFGNFSLENIEVWPAQPECDQPAYLRLALEDQSDQLGENEYGPYYRLHAMTIDSAAITEDGVMITASDADLGTLVIEADYVDGALAEWQTGADVVSELLVGTATLNGDSQPVSFSFWIGD